MKKPPMNAVRRAELERIKGMVGIVDLPISVRVQRALLASFYDLPEGERTDTCSVAQQLQLALRALAPLQCMEAKQTIATTPWLIDMAREVSAKALHVTKA